MKKEERLKELEGKIESLEMSRATWFKTEGITSPKTIKASIELRLLKLEKYDLENGTNELKVYKLERTINELEALKKDALAIKRMYLERKISRKKKKIESYQKAKKK